MKHVCPLSLNVTVALTFDLETPNSIGGRLLVMTNHHIKLEDPWATNSLVIDRTKFVYGPTDRQTDPLNDGPTCTKQYTPPPLFSKGVIIIIKIIILYKKKQKKNIYLINSYNEIQKYVKTYNYRLAMSVTVTSHHRCIHGQELLHF